MPKKNILLLLISAIILIFIIAGFLVVKNINPNNQSTAQPENQPMTITTYNPCDIDFDEDCDIKDYNLIKRALGQCEDGYYYNEPADADHDGCVTEKDLQVLFPEPPPQTFN